MTVTKIMTICASVAVVAVLTSNSGRASDWTGKYTTKDMYGKPMSITADRWRESRWRAARRRAEGHLERRRSHRRN